MATADNDDAHKAWAGDGGLSPGSALIGSVLLGKSPTASVICETVTGWLLQPLHMAMKREKPDQRQFLPGEVWVRVEDVHVLSRTQGTGLFWSSRSRFCDSHAST